MIQSICFVCGTIGIETSEYFLFHCPNYATLRLISRVFETTNRAKLLDLDLYTESKSIRSITKNTRCCA